MNIPTSITDNTDLTELIHADIEATIKQVLQDRLNLLKETKSEPKRAILYLEIMILLQWLIDNKEK